MTSTAKPMACCASVLALVLLVACAPARQTPVARQGVLDLREWDLAQAGTVPLVGEWAFYWQALLTPAELHQAGAPAPTAFETLPGAWNGLVVPDTAGDAMDGAALPAEGYATYQLTVWPAPGAPPLALRMPWVETAYRLYVNGALVREVGQVGTTPASSVPAHMPQVVDLPTLAAGAPLELVLQVSNFHNPLGGVQRGLWLGSTSQVHQAHERALAADVFVAGSLLALTIYHWIIYTLRRNDRSTLYLGGVFLLSGLRILLQGETFFWMVFPNPGWELSARLPLLMPALSAMFLLMFFEVLFPEEFSRRALYGLLVGAGVHFALVLVLPTRIGLQVGIFSLQVLIFSQIAYSLYAFVLIVRRRRAGATPLLVGISAVMLASLSDLFNNGFFLKALPLQPQPLGPFGILLFAFSQAFLLAQRFSLAQVKAETLSAQLEERVSARTNELAMTNSALAQEVAAHREAVQEMYHQNAYLQALGDTAAGLLTRLELHELLETIVIRAGYLLNTAHGFMCLVEPDPTRLVVRVATGLLKERVGMTIQAGEGVAGRIWRTGKPLTVDDYDSWAGRMESYPAGKIYAIAGVPLQTNGHVNGVLGLVYAIPERTFGPLEIELLTRFAQMASLALDNARLFESAQRRVKHLATLNEIGRAIASHLTLDKLLEAIFEETVRVIPADVFFIALHEPARNCMVFALVYDDGQRFPPHDSRPLPELVETNLYRAFMEKHTVSILRSPEEYARAVEAAAASRVGDVGRPSASILHAPIMLGAETIGVLSVQSYQLNAYSVEDTTLLGAIALQTAAAIQQARLYAQAQAELEERRRIEGELQEAKLEAEEASRAKSQFLANMSHELRTPLNAIIGYSEFLYEQLSERNEPQLAANLQKIATAGHHLLKLVNDVLDFVRLDAGNLEFHYELFPITPVLERLTRDAEMLAAKQHNRVVTDVPLDPGVMQGDPVRVHHVLNNLVSNAAKFTRDGVITLGVRRQADARGTEFILFTVTDTGIGMTAEQMTHLFQEFWQADATSIRQQGGTGLGLALSQRMCRLMGGEIQVVSVPGQGSTFTLCLPAVVGLTEVHG